jgi:hypothetical protein
MIFTTRGFGQPLEEICDAASNPGSILVCFLLIVLSLYWLHIKEL